MYDIKWCRNYYHFSGYPKLTTWEPPEEVEAMRNLFMAVMSQDVKYIKKLMDDEVDILGYTNSAGFTAVEVATKNRKRKILDFFRENGITEARLVEKRGGVKPSNSTDFNFGKFGKFQERYMFHNKAQNVFNLAMDASRNFTKARTRSTNSPRMSTYIP